MGRKLRTAKGWFSRRNEASSNVVFVANAIVALGVGYAAAQALKLSFNGGLVVAVVAFAALMACMLSARAAWLATVAGSAGAGAVAGYVGSAFFVGKVTSVIGGGAIGAAAFGLTLFFYRHLVRVTTGAGGMEGRYVGTFNQLDDSRRRGTGDATAVIAVSDGADHEVRLTGLVLGGVPVELLGKRREEEDKEPFLELSLGPVEGARLVLLRGWARADDAMLIVDLEGSPFGTYVFTGQRQRE